MRVRSHGEVLGAIPAYLAGRLDSGARGEVDDHVGGCASCAEALEECRDLLEVMRAGGESLFEPHPDEQALRAHALGSGTREDPGMARHLASCPSCQIEVVAWTRREERLAIDHGATAGTRDAGHSAAVGSRWGPGLLWRVAALLVVGVAVGVALDRLLMTPRPAVIEPRAAAPPPAEPAADPGGPVALVILHGTLRGSEPLRVVRPDPGARMILIAIAPPLPQQASASDRYRFEIGAPGPGVVWSTEMTADAIRRLRGTGEVVVLAIPITTLGEGRREIRMTGPLSGGAEPPLLMQIPFEVEGPAQRQSPAATNAPQ